MTKKISQRAAIKLRKRVKELEQSREYSKDTLRYGWGTTIGSYTLSEDFFTKVKTANLLGHAVLIRLNGYGLGGDLQAVKYE